MTGQNSCPAAVARPAAGLAQRLATAARSTGERRGPGRCAAVVVADEMGAVVQRCPARPGHRGEHTVESEAARSDRLRRAAVMEPWQVQDAVEGVLRWLGPVDGAAGVAMAPDAVPWRQLWLLVEVAEAAAAGEEPGCRGSRGVQ